METREDLNRKADNALHMLDEIDEMIEQDNSYMLDSQILRARQMYSAEWRSCVDMLRKLQPDEEYGDSDIDSILEGIDDVR